jgi:hypothetical protein
MQSRGVQNLPVQMQFKSGGIIGYNGEGESEVRAVPVSEIQTSPAYIELRRQGVSAPEAYRQVEQILSAQPAPQVPVRVPGSLSPTVAADRSAEAQLVQRPPSYALPLPESRDQASETGAQEPPKPVKSETKPDFTVTQVPAPSAAPIPQIAVGERPVRPSSQNLGAGIVDLPNFKGQIDKLRDIAAQREQALEAVPQLERKGIAALQTAEQERQRLLEERRKDDFLNKLIAWGRDVYTRGNSYGNVLEGIRLREEQSNQAKLNYEKSVLDLERAEQERKLQKFDRMEALENKAIARQDQMTANLLTSAQIGATLAANTYSAELKSFTDSTIANANLASEAAKIRVYADANNLTRLSNAASSWQSRLNTALKEINDTLEKEFKLVLPQLAMPRDKPDPQLDAQVVRMNQRRAALEKQFGVTDIRQQIQQIQSQMMTPMRFDASGNQVK